MENYIVSARKYRPSTFDSVVGQEHITHTLQNAIKSGHIAQAFLFCGPRGVGKTTCARILAKTINCENPTDDIEPCNHCNSCETFDRNASFNITELDAASNNSVEDIRALVEQVRIPPQTGKYKVYIIDEVHMLSQAAFNAFLKTLEEPPAYAKFILATTEKNKIIPTILSRCQVFDFKRITTKQIVEHLKHVATSENIAYEEEALHVIASKADGGMRDALSLFDQLTSFSEGNLTYKKVIDNLNVLDHDYFFKITDSVLAGNFTDILLIINEIFNNGFEPLHFITGYAAHLRNLLLCKESATRQLMQQSETLIDRYSEQAAKCSVSMLLYSLNIFNKCDVEHKDSNNKKMLVEVALLNTSAKCISDQKKKSDNDVNTSESQQNIHNNIQTKTGPTRDIKTNVVAEEKITSEPAKHTTVSRLIRLSDVNKKEETSSISKEIVENQPLVKDNVAQTINNFALSIKDKNPFLANVLDQCVFNIIDENTIEIHFANKVNEDAFLTEKINFAGYLRKNLHNDKVFISNIVDEQVIVNKPYTDSEKLAEMIKKNKDILYLKNTLKLETDY